MWPKKFDKTIWENILHEILEGCNKPYKTEMSFHSQDTTNPTKYTVLAGSLILHGNGYGFGSLWVFEQLGNEYRNGMSKI